MRFAVAQWAPEYGTPTELDETTGRVEVGIEVPAGEWRGLVPDVEPVEDVLFIDGVRRVDANLWIEQPQGRPALGLAATYAAGAVRSEEHTSELQSRPHLVCRLLLEKKKK